MVKAPAGSRDIVNFVSYLYITSRGLGFLKLANIVLILIIPSPCYVKIEKCSLPLLELRLDLYQS